MKKDLIFLFTVMLVYIGAHAQITPTDGTVYVREMALGAKDGSSWANATDNLQGAIDAEGVTKVFVAIGTYPSPTNGFVMKNNVTIYGGFDPTNNITTLAHSRILPTATVGGSVLNGENAKRVINNYNGTNLNNTAVLDGFTVTGGNADYASGGGIENFWSNPVFYNLVIKGNSAAGGGGANLYSSAVFTNVEISNNTAQSATGGGMSNANSSPVLTNVVISNNRASLNGGAMQTANGSPVLTNVKITGNTTDAPTGSAMFYESFGSGTTTLNNVTIASNSSSAINLNNNSQNVLNIKNSIVYGGIINGTYNSQYSLIEGNSSTTNGNLNATDITLADIFTNPSGGDYTLKTGSAAIEKGNNALYSGLNVNTQDLAGNARLMGVAIDLGVYERFAMTADNSIIYVKETASGNGTGSSWANATSDLHNAIHTTGVTKVFVAIGNYNVGANSFVMKNNVEIYGGFDPANGIIDFTHNRILPNRGTAEGSVLNGQNVRPVIWNDNNGLNNSAVIDGFTLKNGYRSSGDGAGIFNNYSSPTFRNLVVKSNQASSNAGGGAYLFQTSSVFINCIFKANTANTAGGGLSTNSDASKLINCLITGNSANNAGGGIYISNSWGMNITNCTIEGNSGSTGYYVSVPSTKPVLQNSIIWEGYSDYAITNTTVRNSLIKDYNNTSDGNIDATGFMATDIFTNPSAGDYTLKSTSPAINMGNNSLNNTTADLVGNARVYNAGLIDMGAYEYQGAPVLPVTLISFTAKADGNRTKLQWQTAMETDNASFIIYRSGDGSKFEHIGEKQGAGVSVTTNSYTLYDSSPLNGINYYQLIQVDNDGKISNLGVRSLVFNFSDLDLKMYPNPTEDQLNVSFETGRFSQLELVDLNGRLLQKVSINNTENSIDLSLIGYPKGIYMVKLRGNNKEESRKVIKK